MNELNLRALAQVIKRIIDKICNNFSICRMYRVDYDGVYINDT